MYKLEENMGGEGMKGLRFAGIWMLLVASICSAQPQSNSGAGSPTGQARLINVRGHKRKAHRAQRHHPHKVHHQTA